MEVVLDKQPEKYLDKLNEPDFSRIESALEDLSKEPPEGDIVKLKGKKNDQYRLRVGDFRAIFCIEHNKIIVSKIAPRGQAYKKGGKK